MRKTILILMIGFMMIASAAFSQFKMRSRRTGTSGPSTASPKKMKVSDDTVEFKNGDRLTGNLISLTTDKMQFNSMMLYGISDIPIVEVKRILFPDRIGDEAAVEEDQVILLNEDRLSISVESVNDKMLSGRRITGGVIELEKDNLQGIIFKKAPITVMEQDFEDPEDLRFEISSGEWIVENGGYTQKTVQHSSFLPTAYARLTQQGHFKYQWSVEVSNSSYRRHGFYFFVNKPKATYGGKSYHLAFQRQSITLYRCADGNQYNLGHYNMPSDNTIMKCEIEYDPAKGSIAVIVNDRRILDVTDPNPHKNGRYVMLESSGNTSFDDVKIYRIGGGSLPDPPDESIENDIILFQNGDFVTGKVVDVSEEYIIIENEDDPEGMVIAKSRISSLRFRKSESESEDVQDDIQKVIMWNGDTITGQVVSLDENNLRIKSSGAGELVFSRKLLRQLVIP